MLTPCQNTFESRDDLALYVQKLSPQARTESLSPIQASQRSMMNCLSKVDPVHYARSRNFLDGAVSHLSPFIAHGMVGMSRVRDMVLQRFSVESSEKFVQQLAWRDFWQRLSMQHPEWLWHNIESYKTGWSEQDYVESMPNDILEAATPVTCINQMIKELYETGWIHNHLRLYLASYVVHWRRIRWQTGAEWFMSHLLDGCLPSNNFSWQWVASTFSHKPYIFNLENVKKYSGGALDTCPEHNRDIDDSYEALGERLFPYAREV